jgi:hypothetical protein
MLGWYRGWEGCRQLPASQPRTRGRRGAWAWAARRGLFLRFEWRRALAASNSKDSSSTTNHGRRAAVGCGIFRTLFRSYSLKRLKCPARL